MTEDRTEPKTAALRLIAGDRCERYTSGSRCSDPDGGKVLGLRWTADNWCYACIANAALNDTWPVVTDSSPWGYITPRGNIFGGGLQPTDPERMARWGARQCGGALIREARPGVWVAVQ